MKAREAVLDRINECKIFATVICEGPGSRNNRQMSHYDIYFYSQVMTQNVVERMLTFRDSNYTNI